VGNKLQVARAEAALAQTQAQVPQIESQIVTQENAINVLLGRQPGPIPRGQPLVDRPAPSPTPPGLPSALLERRPDVMEAEHTVASANAQVGVAVADFFPRIGLTALYGGQSTQLSDIVKDSFNLWNVAGNMTGPLFQGFAILEQYHSQVAGWEQTKAQYEQTVLNAFAEVSDALTAQTRLGDARSAQQRAVDAYQESVRLSLVRYRSGLAGYYEVLDAQQQLFPAEISLARIQLNELLTVVTLYRALGGGWKLTPQQWTQKP
jgi:multidrug efflux system outer membrane protein